MNDAQIGARGSVVKQVERATATQRFADVTAE
jgi:hypothetical protein